MLLKRRPLLALAALLCGCTGPNFPRARQDAGPCVQSVVGNASAAIELEPFAIVGGQPKVLHAGDPIPLLVPGQGGYIVYAGARARNLLACDAFITAQLLDPDTGQAATGLSGRSVSFVDSPDGYYQARGDDLESESPNIPACPDQLGLGVAGRTLVLQISVQDSAGKIGKVSIKVVPQCPPGDPHCACVCGPNFHGGC